MGFLGDALFGKKIDFGSEKWNLDPENKAGQMIDRVSSPTYGIQQYERLANAGPTLNDYLGMQGATGGSGAIARQQFTADRHRASGQAFDSYGDFRMGIDSQVLPGLIGLQADLKRFPLELEAQQQFTRNASRTSLWNNLIGGAGRIASSAMGGGGFGGGAGGPGGDMGGGGFGGFEPPPSGYPNPLGGPPPGWSPGGVPTAPPNWQRF